MHLKKALKETAPTSKGGKYACSKRQQAIFLFAKFSPSQYPTDTQMQNWTSRNCKMFSIYNTELLRGNLRAPSDRYCDCQSTPPPWLSSTVSAMTTNPTASATTSIHNDQINPDFRYMYQGNSWLLGLLDSSNKSLLSPQTTPFIGFKTSCKRFRWWKTCEGRQTRNSLDSWQFTLRNGHQPD